jgi:hypothetical protein
VLLVGLPIHRDIVRKFGKESRTFSVAARAAILATVRPSSTVPSGLLLTSCRGVAAFGQIAIKSQSSLLVMFGFYACLCGRSPQKASVPFVSHERRRGRCTSLVLNPIAESGLICPNALMQFL